MTREYTVLYADTRRSSFLPLRPEISGRIEWEFSLKGKEGSAASPKALLNSGDVFIVQSDEQIIAVNSQGRKLWRKEIVFGSPVSIAEGRVYFRSQKTEVDELSAVLLDGTEIRETMILLDTFESAYPIYIEPLPDSFIAVCVYRVGVEDGSPEVVCYRKAYPSEEYSWVSSYFGGVSLQPLHIREMNRFVMFTSQDVRIHDSESPHGGKEMARFDVPFPQLSEACAAEDGTLYILGSEESQLSLVALSLNGEELWKYTGIPFGGYRDHQKPPVLGVDKLVHVFAGNTLLSIREGKQVGGYVSQHGPISYATALIDGSLLLAAGLTLVQIDVSGAKIREIEVEHAISAPPVVDKDGKVYVVTAEKLYKID